MTTSATTSEDVLSETAGIVAAFVSNNSVQAGQLPELIESVHRALVGLTQPQAAEPEVEPHRPAVPIKKSVTPDYVICLEDGLKFKSLKRHLQSKYGMTPAEYRAKWGLPNDYPMVAPAYAEARSNLAKAMGLGQQRKKTPPAPVKRARAAKPKAPAAA